MPVTHFNRIESIPGEVTLDFMTTAGNPACGYEMSAMELVRIRSRCRSPFFQGTPHQWKSRDLFGLGLLMRFNGMADFSDNFEPWGYR